MRSKIKVNLSRKKSTSKTTVAVTQGGTQRNEKGRELRSIHKLCGTELMVNIPCTVLILAGCSDAILWIFIAINPESLLSYLFSNFLSHLTYSVQYIISSQLHSAQLSGPSSSERGINESC